MRQGRIAECCQEERTSRPADILRKVDAYERQNCRGTEEQGTRRDGREAAFRGSRMLLLALTLLLLVASANALIISISGNPAKSVNATSARIEWNTDVDATSRVDYGTTPQLGLYVDNPSFTRFHSVKLDGLDANVKYYFQIISIAASGEYAVSNNNGAMYFFTTNSGADILPPAYANVRATAFSATSTTFQWTTNEPATTFAYFGGQEPYQKIEDTARVTDHVVTLPTDSGRLYSFVAGGCDASDNCANATKIRFLAGEQTGTPPLTTDIPRYVNENRLIITGVTRPFSAIDIYVNAIKQRTLAAEGNGTFHATNIGLTKPVDNSIKLVVTDAAGNTVEQTYPVTIDTVPPKVTISPIPAIASATPLTISGTVSEPSTITYEVQEAFDTTAPSRVTGLRTTDVKQNSVALTWNDNVEPDVAEFAVYRNDVRIATVAKTSYTDAVSSGTPYTYRVAAVDKSCNVGALSDSVLVQTPNGGTSLSGEPTEAPLTCYPQKQTLQASGQFAIAANLQNGNNQIRITVEDVAGNKVSFLNTTRLDNQAPQILEDNLAKISPTYIREVTIKGKISEQATVVIYVNGQNMAHEVTGEDGAFSIKVFLPPASAGSGNLSRSPTGNAVLDTGTGETSYKIRIEATDFAGHTAKKEGTVKYALCGEGSWFKVDVGEISPTVVTPRLIIEGVQQLGFPVNISYRGAGKAVIQRVTVTPLTLSLGQQDEWDNDWVQVNSLFPKKSSAGYVQVVFPPQAVGLGQTTSKKEDELAGHRKSAACPTGCVKLFLQLDIQAQEELPKRYSDVRLDRSTGNVTVENIRQKSCMPILVEMDVPAHLGDKIPKRFLQETSQFLSSAIDTIDSLLRPLTTIGTYTLYGCFAMNGWLFVKFVNEALSCDAASITGGFKRDIAEIGACDQAYPKDNEGMSSKNSACHSCQSAIEGRKGHEYNMRLICDRVACPSAPTLQTYIKDMQKKGVRQTDVIDAQNNHLYAGSSCGFRGTEQNAASTEREHVQDFRPTNLPVGYGYEDVKNIYVNYQTHKNDKPVNPKTAQTASVTCAGAHPAKAECCGYEYYEEWGSACGIPGVVETFDELEQSACLAAQAANKVRDFEQEASKAAKSQVTCNSLFNSVAGFCEPNTGQPVSDFIPTGIFYNGLPTANVNGQSREIFIEIRPDPPQDAKSYKVLRGYVYKTYESVNQTGNSRYLNEKNQFYPDGTDLTPFFKDNTLQPQGQPQQPSGADIQSFAHALCDKVSDNGVCLSKSKDVYNNIKSRIGVPEKTYIVRPDADGILRSIQCVCLPAVTSYLGFWRNVLGAVKGCVDHTLLTGEGSSGVCKAVLSQYVCDMLYDLLRCFLQKYSSPGAGSNVAANNVGDVLGALTSAGSRMQQSVQGRYGESALWKSMFADNKLLHSICTFAFTGQWDLDVKGLFQQTVQTIPIESQGLVYPADRRYVAYDPTTKPSGMTTWLYHFGVGLIAGADLNYQLSLKCSNSIRCQTRDGFKDGKCDCYGKSEKMLPVIAPELGNGQLKKNDILNTELFFTMQGGNGGSEVRYDTAVLEWEWKDSKGAIQHGKVEKEIHLSGSDAPNFCKLELLETPFFLCRFNIGDYASALITRDPVMKNPPGNVLLLNSPGDFGVTVNLFGQADPRQQNGAATSANTKFLVYELRNGNLIVVDSNKETPLKVETEGEKEYAIQTKTIERSMFGAQSTTGFRVADYMSFALPDKYSYPRELAIDYIDPIKTSSANIPPTSTFTIVAVFVGDGVDIYQSTGRTLPSYMDPKTVPAGSGDWGLFSKALPVAPFYHATFQNGAFVIRDPGNRVLPLNAEIVVTFKPGKVPTNGAELLVRYTPQTGANICDRFSTTPDRWTATFTLYDAKKPTYGGAYEPNYEQITTNSEGQRQQRSMTIGAVCNTAYQAPTGNGTKAGFPSDFRFCSDDPTTGNTNTCYCASAADAFVALQTSTLEYNCGPFPDKTPGTYCGYTSSVTRQCTQTPLSTVPVIFAMSFIKVDDTTGQLTPTVKSVVNGKVTLSPGKYALKVSAYGAGQYDFAWGVPPVDGSYGNSDPASPRYTYGRKDYVVLGPGGFVESPFSYSLPGDYDFPISISDGADATKKSTYPLKITVISS